MRVVKEADERRSEILDAAEKLFAEKGFEGTSTTDIQDEVGIARGTLYYHFRSKEDILDALVERTNSRLIAKAAGIASDKDIPVLQRLTQMMLAMHVEGEAGHELVAQMHKPQNALLHQKMRQGILTGLVPILSGLISEACAEGICQTDFPDEVAEMSLLYSLSAFDDAIEASPERRDHKIRAFICGAERLLSMPSGSMRQVLLPIFQRERT